MCNEKGSYITEVAGTTYFTGEKLSQVGNTSHNNYIGAMIHDYLNVSTQGVLLSIVTIGAVIS